MMFGYACDETPALMPFPIYYAHRIVQRQSEVRRDGRLPFLRPDAKSQVTVRYRDGKPVGIETVVLSTQHHPSMNDKQAELAEAVIEEIVKPVLPKEMLDGVRYLDDGHATTAVSAARCGRGASRAPCHRNCPRSRREGTATARVNACRPNGPAECRGRSRGRRTCGSRRTGGNVQRRTAAGRQR